jgi:hypothetical protein
MTFWLRRWIDHVAVLVAEHLDLDVARIGDELLDEDAVVTEGGSRLRRGAGEALGHLVGGTGDAHALATAAGGSLDHHRIADLVGDGHRLLRPLDDAEIAWNRRDLRGGGRLFGFDLVAHGRDGAGVRADEDDAGLGERLRKGLALGEEAVARMHGLGAGLPAGFDDLLDHEVGLGGSGRPDMDGLVGHLHVEGIPVGIGIDGHGLDAHAPGSLDDPARNLAPVGNQDLVEHEPSNAPPKQLSPTSVTAHPCLGEAGRFQHLALDSAPELFPLTQNHLFRCLAAFSVNRIHFAERCSSLRRPSGRVSPAGARA